ncbi:MAG: GntR family transcriptional regulator [Bacteroidia bacterium]|nr:GntR family transcriptional regulator [Bacteroidia bacterium]
MEFREKQAIYIQITEYICEQILLKKWKTGDKIISIRDLAIVMEVNPNTIQRAYDYLQQLNIIINKRGIGYFIEQDSESRILAFRREQFFKNEMPQFFRNMFLLKINIDDLKIYYTQFLTDNFNNPKDETK